MFKGGYKIIDLKNTLLTLGSGTGVVIAGIYDAIEENRKAVLLSGLHTTDGQTPATIVEYGDIFTSFVPSSTDFIATIPVNVATSDSVTTATFIKITVDDDDKVYVASFTTTDTQPE